MKQHWTTWTPSVILDTNFLIALDNENPAAIETAREIEAKGLPRRVPRIVVFELWTAVGQGSQTAHNRQKFERLLEGLPQVGLSAQIARHAGEIEGQARASDSNNSGVGTADAIIAATALEYEEPVVTNDRKDFVKRMQDEIGLSQLQVELYE